VIQEKIDWANKREAILGAKDKRAIAQEWSIRWRIEYRRGWFSITATEEPSVKQLKLYNQLKKVESIVLV